MSEQKITFNRKTLVRLRNAVGMFLKSPVGRRAKWLMAALLTLMLCINGMNVANSYVGRYFMSAIEKRDAEGARSSMYTHLQAALDRYRKTADKEPSPSNGDLRPSPSGSKPTRRIANKRIQTQRV